MTDRLFLPKDKRNYLKILNSNGNIHSSFRNDLLESRNLNSNLNLYKSLRYFALNSNKIINNNSCNNINVNSLNLNKNLTNFNSIKCNNKSFYTMKTSLIMVQKDINIKEMFCSLLKKTNELQNYTISIYSAENKTRKYVLEKLKIFLLKNNISSKIFYRTIFLFDLIQMKNNIYKYFNTPNINEKIALISLILIMKFNYMETKMIHFKKFEKIFNEFFQTEIFSINLICQMEILALKLINYDLNFTTPFCFIELMLSSGIIINNDNLNNEINLNMYKLINDTLGNIVENSNEYFKYNYFYIACSVISFAREKFNLNKWPKNIENAFNINFDQFYNVFRNFFGFGNKNYHCYSTFSNIYEYENIINIQNLQNMNNIVNVMRIMTSKEKDNNKKIKNEEKIKNDEKIKNNENNKNLIDGKYIEKSNTTLKNNEIPQLENGNVREQINIELKTNWDLSAIKSPIKNKKILVNKSEIIKKLNEKSIEIKNDNSHNNNSKEKKCISRNTTNIKINTKRNINNKNNSDNINLISNFDMSDENKTIKNENDVKYSLNNNINRSSEKINNNNKLNMVIHPFKRSTYFSRKRLINNFQNEQNKNINIEIGKTEENTINNNINTVDSIENKNYNSNYSTSKRRDYHINFHFATTISINNNSNNINNINNNKENSKENSNEKFDTKKYFLRRKYANYKNYNTYNNDKKKQGDLLSIDTVKISNFLDKPNKNIKVKEENSNEATCEDSKQAKDFSIRKTYCLKKRKFFERNNDINDLKTDNINESKKNEKTKSYGKFMDNKIKLSHNTFNITGVRKYYKQKNMYLKH